MHVLSLSLRRAWIEIGEPLRLPLEQGRRSPYGERGLKYQGCGENPDDAGRSPYGERGLKFIHGFRVIQCVGRSPYGERGLKFSLTGR